jgi:glutamine amidotransferase
MGIPIRSGAIVDFGLGNLAALRRKVAELDPAVRVATTPDEVAAASWLILPGVGHFAHAMENLERRGLVEILHDRVIHDHIPILGICVGMQLFARHSEEGDVPGLGWIDAEVRRIQGNGLKVPHIGWKSLEPACSDPILDGLSQDQRFYFIHSYRFDGIPVENEIAWADYGGLFPAVIRRQNIVGVQFHPEKSHRGGMRVIANFLREAAA